jgi:hypothetical protein
MKKFLRKVGLLTAAVMMMSSGVAYATDSVEANGWMRSAPDDDLANAASAGSRTDNNLRRNQTLYWAIKGNASDANHATVIDTSLATPATATCTLDGATPPACSSAPLFISAPSATICVDSDLAGTGDGLTEAQLRICSDSTCVDNTSAEVGLMDPTASGQCQEFSGAGIYDGYNVGAMWVFLEVTTNPSDTATTLFWVTGN